MNLTSNSVSTPFLSKSSLNDSAIMLRGHSVAAPVNSMTSIFRNRLDNKNSLQFNRMTRPVDNGIGNNIGDCPAEEIVKINGLRLVFVHYSIFILIYL